MTEEQKFLDGEIPAATDDFGATPLIPGTEIIGRRARKMALLAEEAEEQIPLWDPANVQIAGEEPAAPAEEASVEFDQATEEFPSEKLPSEELPSEEPVFLSEQKPARSRKKGSAVSPFVEFVEVIAGALIAAILVLTLICRTGVVDGSSMVPTMYHGDRYVISDLFYSPKQGDIVVFRPAIDGEEELWIKRVVAVEGQTVYINPETYRVYVDGVELDEPYLNGMGTIPHSTPNPITVPKGCVYVLGDNRTISHDSRYEDLGCVEIGQLAGRVILRFWPLKSFDFYL